MTESELPEANSLQFIQVELGRRIRACRTARGFTQEDLAQEAGIGLRTLRRLEAGRSTSLESLLRIALALDMAGAMLDAVPPRDESLRQPSDPRLPQGKPPTQRPLERPHRGWSGHPWTWGTDVID